MTALRTEGVILRVIPFQDHHQILTVFSLEHGLCRLIFKRGKAKAGLCVPLTEAEFIYRKTNSELLQCQEISLINAHLGLRHSLAALQASCDLSQAVMTSQVIENPGPLLYRLFTYYLNKIPLLADPQILVASFRLKLLQHEGLFSPENQSFFSKDEMATVAQLAACRKWQELTSLAVPPNLQERIVQFFNSTLQ